MDAVLADVCARGVQRCVGRVGLRRARQVGRALGQRVGALRHPHELHGVGRRDRDLQGLRRRVADVLAGQDDHPPGDEARVLAASSITAR
jgi:hypothetical protein